MRTKLWYTLAGVGAVAAGCIWYSSLHLAYDCGYRQAEIDQIMERVETLLVEADRTIQQIEALRDGTAGPIAIPLPTVEPIRVEDGDGKVTPIKHNKE